MGLTRATMASSRRHIRLVRGDPSLVAQAVAVPLVLLVLCALMFGGWGDDWPAAVVDHDESERSRELVQEIGAARSSISPYFDVLEQDPQTTRDMLDRGRLQLLVEIPEGFSDGTEQVRTELFNINSDATKNLRLRFDKVLNSFDHAAGAMPVTVELDRAQDEDVPRSAFIAGSVFLITILLGAGLVAANLYALETEERTIKEVLLSPVGVMPYPMSCLLTGAATGLLAGVPLFAVGWAAFGLAPAWQDLAAVAVLMVPCSIAAAGVGVLAAQIMRRHRTIQPVLILSAIMTFFAGGGFVAADGLPPLARQAAAWWPPSRVFEWGNPVLHGFAQLQGGTVVWAYSAALIGVGVAAFAGRRERAAQQRGV